jgi:hypothetical protein
LKKKKGYRLLKEIDIGGELYIYTYLGTCYLGKEELILIFRFIILTAQAPMSVC